MLKQMTSFPRGNNGTLRKLILGSYTGWDFKLLYPILWWQKVTLAKSINLHNLEHCYYYEIHN